MRGPLYFSITTCRHSCVLVKQLASTPHIYGRQPLVVHLSYRHKSSMDGGTKRKADKLSSLSPPPVRKQKIESSTTREAVSSFFTPVSSKQTGKMTWTTVDSTLLVGHFQSTAELEGRSNRMMRRKIAAFDLDSTLIKSSSGKRYSGADDWMMWHPSVPKKLKNLDEDDYQIVILSNQSGLNLDQSSKSAKMDQKKVDSFKSKVTAVTKQLDISLSFYAATERDRFRKPRTGIWLEMLDHFDLDGPLNSVDLENSLFVGDAGGRTKDQSSGKDFSSSDRDFSSNVGIKFYTPEEYFLGEPPRAFERMFDPQEYIEREVLPTPRTFTKNNDLDVVVLCGSPGAGKSTFYWNHLAPLGYERVNQDILKTREKCLKKADEFLEMGKSVVIDNTNADPETRAYWVELARRRKIPVRTVVLKTHPKLSEHNDAVRALNGTLMNPESRTRLPEIAFLSFAKRFREPSLTEGFQDITTVEFQFVGSEEQKAAWTQYYV